MIRDLSIIEIFEYTFNMASDLPLVKTVLLEINNIDKHNLFTEDLSASCKSYAKKDIDDDVVPMQGLRPAYGLA